MASKPLSFSIRLFRGNRRVARDKLRYATAFEIWYGKKRLIARRPFPFKRVGERRAFLAELNSSLERRRERQLKHRRVLYRERRRAQARKSIERQVHRKKKFRLPKEFEEEAHRSLVQNLVIEKAYAEEPVKARKAIVEDTIIIPIEPEDDTYEKRVVDKVLVNTLFGRYHLAILDYNLNEEEYIPMTAELLQEAYERAYMKFIPHIMDYFNEVKGSSDMFILRIKFLHHWENQEKYTPMGISLHRLGITTVSQMTDLFRRTFLRMFGDKADPYTTKNKRRTNYLAGESPIFITGFTLEATDVR